MPRYRMKTYEYECDGCKRTWTREQRTDEYIPPPKWQIFLKSKKVGYNIHTVTEIYCDACKLPEIDNE